MSKVRLTLLSSILLLPFLMHAQGNLQVVSDTLVWEADTLTDNVTGNSNPNSSEFTTFRSSKIAWKQSGNGQPVFDFLVTSFDDHWATEGYITFTTTRKSKTYTFRFELSGGNTRVIFSYTQLNETRTFVFNINNVSPLTD